VIGITERIVTLCGESKAAGAWATTDGLAYVTHAGAVLRDGIRWASELKTHAKAEIPSPDRRIIFVESGNFVGRKWCRA
jgi:hypothetical protein